MERVIAECGSGPETLQVRGCPPSSYVSAPRCPTIIPAQPDKTLRFREHPKAQRRKEGGLYGGSREED
eukprot:3590503-Rhodomonas_salina.3